MEENCDMSNEGHLEPETQPPHHQPPVIADLTKKQPPFPSRPEKRKRAKAKKVPGQGTKSDIWFHFTKIEGNESRAKCNYCDATYEADTARIGTSPMWNHLLRAKTGCAAYPYKEHDEGKGQTTLNFQSVTNETTGVTSKALNAVHYTVEEIRKELAAMVILDEMSFRTVEKEGFKRYSYAMNPKFAIPSRTTIARDCLNLYVEEKNKLKKILKSQRVCLTTDTWSSIQNLNYMCVNAHWIDINWNFQKRIISFCLIANHKGETIGKTVEACLCDWGIDNIFTITVDNASSNDVAVKYIQRKSRGTPVLGNEFMHVRCSAHILNLIVKDGLLEQNEHIAAVRNAVRFVRSSPARTKAFKYEAQQEKIDCKSMICLDVETRWNSTYLMLEAAEKFEKAFERLDDEGRYGDYFDSLTRIGPPRSTDFHAIRCFIRFLKIFYNTTKKFSGYLYVTTSVFFNELMSIHSSLLVFLKSTDFQLQNMALKMKEKYDKYWGVSGSLNCVLLVANVLDPRYKMKYIEFCFDGIYGQNSEAYKELIEKIKNTLRQLYEHFHCLDKITTSRAGVETSNNGQASSSNVINIDEFEIDPASILESDFEKHLLAEETVESNSELNKYLSETRERGSDSFDILLWWKINSSRYPVLSQVARLVLAVPVSTVASESAFSTSGRILDSFRSSLSPKTVEVLVCSQNWLRSAPKFEDISDILAEISIMDSIETEFDDVASTVMVEGC